MASDKVIPKLSNKSEASCFTSGFKRNVNVVDLFILISIPPLTLAAQIVMKNSVRLSLLRYN